MALQKSNRLRTQIEKASEDRGISIDLGLHSDLQGTVENHSDEIKQSFPKGSFGQLFWESQRKALRQDNRSMRWDPLMIKWCLYLRHVCGRGYEILRDTGADMNTFPLKFFHFLSALAFLLLVHKIGTTCIVMYVHATTILAQCTHA